MACRNTRRKPGLDLRLRGVRGAEPCGDTAWYYPAADVLRRGREPPALVERQQRLALRELGWCVVQYRRLPLCRRAVLVDGGQRHFAEHLLLRQHVWRAPTCVAGLVWLALREPGRSRRW